MQLPRIYRIERVRYNCCCCILSQSCISKRNQVEPDNRQRKTVAHPFSKAEILRLHIVNGMGFMWGTNQIQIHT